MLGKHQPPPAPAPPVEEELHVEHDDEVEEVHLDAPVVADPEAAASLDAILTLEDRNKMVNELEKLEKSLPDQPPQPQEKLAMS